jgi:hypothetical protein
MRRVSIQGSGSPGFELESMLFGEKNTPHKILMNSMRRKALQQIMNQAMKSEILNGRGHIYQDVEV